MAVLGWTLNPPARLATSAPVVTVTSCGPAGASSAMLNWASRHVGQLTVTELTMMPGPKSMTDVCEKWEFTPTIETGPLWPWRPEDGVIWPSIGAGEDGATKNPPT